MNLANYKTSTDYSLLWELAQENEIVCVVGDALPKAHYNNGYLEVREGTFLFICSRAIEPFIQQCKNKNLKWLVPEVVGESSMQYALDTIAFIDRECSLCRPYSTLPDRIQKLIHDRGQGYSNWQPEESGEK